MCRCKRGCFAVKLEGNKNTIFTKFRSLTYNEQSQFLAYQCIEICEPKRPKIKNEPNPRRKCTVFYFLPLENEKIRVCQRTITDTLKVTPRRIQMLVEKLKNGTEIKDFRGRHTNRPHAITGDIKELVTEHISSFPKQESHYSRSKTNTEFLSEDLTLKKMYKLFCEKYPERDNMSIRTYNDIFQKLNLKFGLPRSDTCTFCDKHYIQLCAANTEEERQTISLEMQMHQMRAKAGYAQIKEDKQLAESNPSNIFVLFIDLQQVLFCPTLHHSSIFYQRQLSNYNLAATSNNAFMMLWNETVAKRGSIEISSCILRYVKEHFQPLRTGERKQLIIWSDRCVGQNNNWRIITTLKLLVDLKYFTEVHQKFLSTGHSFLPCDRDFSLIEKKKKTAKVFVPFEWVPVIAHARESNPFYVLCMQREDFKDLKDLEKALHRDPKFKLTESLWNKISSEDPNTMFTRETHNVLRPWKHFSLVKNIAKYKASTSTFSSMENLPAAYEGPIPISAAKKANLIDMCQYMNPAYRPFYENLITE